MIIIYENKLTKEERKAFNRPGIRTARSTSRENVPEIGHYEEVYFILDQLYKVNIELINNCLYHKQKIKIKYDGKTYTLSSLVDWDYTYQSDKDCLKTTHYRHPVLKSYLDKRSEYFEKKNLEKEKDKYQELVELYQGKLPDESEVDNFLGTFAKLYQVDVDYNDYRNKMLQYYQINWYLDNDIPYANDPSGISLDDELMFDEDMFNISYEEPIEEVSFGDETYFEDYCYKNL